MGEFWKTNKQKEEFLVETWLNETYGKKKSQKTNYATNEDVLNSRSATFKEFSDYVNKKKTAKVSKYQMILNIYQDAVKIVSFANERIGDTSNFLDELVLNRNLASLRNTPENIKPIALFAGNIIGSEWTLANFKNFYNQKITNMNGEEQNVRMFMGLQARKKMFKDQVKRALATGAEVVLMKGPQEFDALNSKTHGVGIDIMSEIYTEINNPNLHYISEGTSVGVNLIKKNVNRKNYYNTLKIETNITTKSVTPAAMAKNANGFNGKSTADVTIRTNGNYTATEFNDNIIYPSGNLEYQNTSKGKYPAQMVNTGSTFLLIPEASNDVTIVLGKGDNLYDSNCEINNANQYIFREKQAIANLIKEKIDNKMTEMFAK